MAGTVVVCMISIDVLTFGLCTAVLSFGLCAALLMFGLKMHKISTASSASTVVASIISTDVLIFGVNSQHFPSSASFQNHRNVVHVL